VAIDGDQSERLSFGLGDQKSIEGVAMEVGKGCEAFQMGILDRKPLEAPFNMTLTDRSRAEIESPKACLDGNFPKAGDAEMDV